jgi:ABC transport system ATP-binding/permease protein
MSEEILKALMQLFAILVKQDGKVTDMQFYRVESFLKQQISPDQVPEYLELFVKASDYKRPGEEVDGEEEGGKRTKTSVNDSVKTLGICKKINKTLEQKQKIVVFARILEMIWADKIVSPLAMEIIDTIADVFKIEEQEFTDIKQFVFEDSSKPVSSPQILTVDGKSILENETGHKHICFDSFTGKVQFLKVNSVELYFVKTDSPNLFMNGLPLKEGQIYNFPSGSTIKLPTGKPIYYSKISSAYLKDKIEVNISFNAKSIGYVFPNGNIGLRNINISEETGKLVGIMGASGAGKSTLLNILNGNDTPTSGQVLINGIDIHKDKNKVDGVIGYVPQDDLLIDELTVYENLYYNGKLCLSHLSDVELDELIIKLLKNLDLLMTKDLKVGNVLEKTISGGQRKRLNIGLELLREPSVLFVDEPTSGLSSRDSENIMDLLRELTLKGKIIFVVIHQPSSDIYKMFDKMFILDVGGYCVFYGNPVEALLYFKKKSNQVDQDSGECTTCGSVNPELIFNIVDAKLVDDYGRHLDKRKVSAEQWNQYYEEDNKVEFVEDVSDPAPNSLHIPSKIKQWLVFIKRDVLSKLKNTQYILINTLEAPALAILLAVIVRHSVDTDTYVFSKNENIPAYIFMSIVVALFMGLTISAEEIIKDRRILKREKFLNLSRFSYLFSKVGILFTISAIQSFLFVILGNYILDIKGLNFEYWLMLFTVGCFANILGLNISASFNSAVTIYILIPLILIPQMILSGAMFSFDKINKILGDENKVPAIAELMVSRWAFEGLSVKQFQSNELEKNLFPYHKLESDLNYRMAYLIPELKSLISSTLDLKSNSDEFRQNVSVIQKAIQKENNLLPDNKKFKSVDLIVPNTFNKDLAVDIKAHLEELNNHYSTYFVQVSDLIDDKKVALSEGSSTSGYAVLKDAYHNESLENLLKNTTSVKKVKVINGELEQIIDPVFRTPELSSIGIRSHFYASIKQLPFSDKYLPTFTMNLLVIWFMSLFAFIVLYFDGLKKIIDVSSSIRIPSIKLPKFKKAEEKQSKESTDK